MIFAHGSSSNRLSPRNLTVASRLHRNNLATLLFDLLSEEEATSDPTGSQRFNIPLLTDRLLSATRWAQQEPGIHDLGIGYFGASTGAAATLAAAAQLPEIRAVVSRGGRTDLAGDSVNSVAAPTLLMVGQFDFPVISWNEATLNRLAGVKQLEIVNHATHLFEEKKTLDQVATRAAAWFTHYLPAVPTGTTQAS